MKYSAGILVARKKKVVEFLLVHLGGPFWENRDHGAWSFPKGLIENDEKPIETAMREWKEETGLPLPKGSYNLLPILVSSQKNVSVFLVQDDVDTSSFQSNMFTMEWPKGSNKMQEFPEADRIEWFSVDDAAVKIHKYLRPIIYQASKQMI